MKLRAIRMLDYLAWSMGWVIGGIAVTVGMALILLSCQQAKAIVPEPVELTPTPVCWEYLGPVDVTVYHAEEEQTDDSPTITADGTDLTKESRRICAVSQDLLWFRGGPLHWGDVINLVIPWDSEASGLCWVHDTMATEYYSAACECMVPVEQHVDIFVPDPENGLYGRWDGKLYYWPSGQQGA